MNAELIDNLRLAAAHFGRGELGEAESICLRLIAKYPAATDAIHLLALVSKQRGAYAEAERLFESCLSIEARADVCANLGNLLATTGRPEQAAAAYRRSLRIDARFRPARLGLARLLIDIGRADEGAGEARRLIDQNGGDAEAWNALASALRLRGRAVDAEDAFREAIKLNRNYGVARHNLGALLAALSRSEEALEELDRAAELGITGPHIDVNRASALLALQRFDEAEQILENSLRRMPAAANAHTLLARIRFMRGNSGYADHFAAAVEEHPDDVPLRLAFSRVLRGAGSFDEALGIVAVQATKSPPEARLLAELAAIHQDAGRFDQALQSARSAADSDPSLAGLDDLLIDSLTCLGRAAEAKPLVDAARRREPLNQWYVAMEATVARLLGDARYAELYDYDAFVRPYDLAAPEGWGSIEEFHRDLIPALMDRHAFQSQPLDQSLRHGTQTPRGLLGDPDPAIRGFLKAIQEPIRRYRESIGFDPDHPYRSRNRGETELSGCWSVRLHRQGYHVNHVHSEGWISSAYYVEVPPEVADEQRKSGWIKFGEPRFAVPGAAAGKMLRPVAGRLVLFPSYMWHGTTPITEDEPRMSIAFDVVPKAE